MFNGFGGFGKKEDENDTVKKLNEANETSKKQTDQKDKSFHGFDPTGLERAAKAARELDGSKNSRNAINLIQLQEQTKQKELEALRAQFMSEQQQLAIKRVHEEESAAQRTLELQTRHDRDRAEYKDQLERKRMVDQINAQRRLQDEERSKQEDSLRRQEQIKRQTLEYEAELRQKTEIARVQAETLGRIKQERDNHDLIIERKRLESQEYRTTVLESIQLATKTIGKGIQDFISDRQKLTNFTITITTVAFGIYTAKVSTSVLGKVIESRLGKPSLIRETSKPNILQAFYSPSSVFKSLYKRSLNQSLLSDIILEPSLEARLKRISTSTFNTKQNKAPYRHLLLYGPPGNGKTMFAKILAKQSNMHYAIMTGGDIAPLGKDAVTEIHKLFDWANTTSKGVIIFIDEADAFLRKRNQEKISEDMRNALNAFLYRTGETSTKFMVVYASNQPEQFDWAINDRIDELIEFNLPSYNERYRLIKQYINIYLQQSNQSKVITMNDINDELIEYITNETNGFSGREISKLAIAWQAAAYGNSTATIDESLVKQVLNDFRYSKSQKLLWNTNSTKQ